jgi:carbamate kinase
MERKLALVALGGNALLRGDQIGTIDEQEEKYLSYGSMAQKIEACLNFIKNGGRMSVITEAFKLADKKFGSKITMGYEDDRR